MIEPTAEINKKHSSEFTKPMADAMPGVGKTASGEGVIEYSLALKGKAPSLKADSITAGSSGAS